MQKVMKKPACALVILTSLLFICLLAASCSGGASGRSDADLDKIVGQITEKYGLTGGYTFSSSYTELGKYLDEDLIQGFYGDALSVPDFSKISGYCVYIDQNDANVIIDVGLFRMNDMSYSSTLKDYLKARILDKREDYDEYPTIDIETLDSAVIGDYGDIVYYVIAHQVDDIVKDIKEAIK
ncbi:MAG: DUF4358 domain-containing protein [Clostridia bacterium]|nr:DUF4358 domain-containing protein [Clostridia bacterium]